MNAHLNNPQQPTPSSLENPFYYLDNALTLIDWVVELHADLLESDELRLISNLRALPRQAQGLLIRMIMRTDSLFLVSQLSHYTELDQPIAEMLRLIAEAGLIEIDAALDTEQLIRLLRREQLLEILNQQLDRPLPKATPKRRIAEQLLQLELTPRSLSAWLGDAAQQAVRVLADPLFERIRLLFFGNLHQSWSEFVLTELGYTRFEPVRLSRETRVFKTRQQVDLYLHLHQLEGVLDQQGFDAQLLELAAAIETESDWLSGRRARLLLRLGQQAQRADQTRAALAAYQASALPEAQIRHLRLLEKQGAYPQIAEQLQQLDQQRFTPIDRLLLNRIDARCAKKLGRPFSKPTLREPETLNLELAQEPGKRVERLCAAALTQEYDSVFYVENSLINGLFALLFWPAIYADIEGAFFHPFQPHPADQFRRGFVGKRQAIIDQQLARLDDGSYKQAIRTTAQQKQGITNSLIYWPAVDEPLLSLALELIPAAHLKAIFVRLLSDLRTHRSGFPDLIAFDTKGQRYRLIEVKGPGDRLQDNQRLWLDYFCEQQIPASVCHVSWKS